MSNGVTLEEQLIFIEDLDIIAHSNTTAFKWSPAENIKSKFLFFTISIKLKNIDDTLLFFKLVTLKFFE